MKIIKDLITSGVIGTEDEIMAVRGVLTFDQGSFINLDNMFYTGLVDFLVEQLGDNIPIEIESVDTEAASIIPVSEIDIPKDFLIFEDPTHEIRDYQIRASKKMIHKQKGIIESATGSGKTEMAAIIIKWLLENGIVDQVYFVTETTFLMNQAFDRFQARGLCDVTRFGGGYKFDKNGVIQCCVVDSLVNAIKKKRVGVLDSFSKCGLIIFDEVHHLQAATWISVGELCPARYRIGLTATLWSDPFRYSYNDLFLIGLTGGLAVQIPSKFLRNQGYLAEPVVTMIEVRGPEVESMGSWDSLYTAGIVQNPLRNSYIVSLAESLYINNRKTLIFVSRINHGLLLAKYLKTLGCDETYFVKGGEEIHTWKLSGRWDRRQCSIDSLASLVRDNERVIVIGTCLSGDTEIPLLDGETKTVKELSESNPNGGFWVYSCTPDGEIVPGYVSIVSKTRRNADLVKVKIDNGEYEITTPDHSWMLRDGTYKKAEDLKPGDSLMPLYIGKNKRGYATVKVPKTGEFKELHRISAAYKYGEKIIKGWTVHHVDFNKYNNCPDNLLLMSWRAHIKFHNIMLRSLWKNEDYVSKLLESRRKFWDSNRSLELRKKVGESLRNYNKSWDKSGESNPRYDEFITVDNVISLMQDPLMTIGYAAKNLNTSIKVVRNRLRIHLGLGWLETMRLIHGENYYNNGVAYANTILHSNIVPVTFDDIFEKMVKDPSLLCNDLAAMFKTHRRSIREKVQEQGFESFKEFKHMMGIPGNNHKVVSVERLSYKEDTYNLTVNEWHNFATDSGVFLKNSVLDEGIDIPSFDTLIMGTAMKKYRRSVQRVGRGMRPKEGDNRVFIFDFIDNFNKTLLSHSEYRLQTYQLEEYEISKSMDETSDMLGPLNIDKGFYQWQNPYSNDDLIGAY